MLKSVNENVFKKMPTLHYNTRTYASHINIFFPLASYSKMSIIRPLFRSKDVIILMPVEFHLFSTTKNFKQETFYTSLWKGG